VVVEYHRYDQYSTAWGDSRADFYVDAFGNYVPHMIFDGVLDAGSNDILYKYWFETRENLLTDVTITPEVFLDGTSCRVMTMVCLEPGGSPRALNLYTVQLLDLYPSEWDYSRNTFQQAAPLQELFLDAGACTQVSADFILDSTAADLSDQVVVVVWAQEPALSGPAEVAQAAAASWPFSGVFTNGFESGDLTAWSASTTRDGSTPPTTTAPTSTAAPTSTPPFTSPKTGAPLTRLPSKL